MKEEKKIELKKKGILGFSRKEEEEEEFLSALLTEVLFTKLHVTNNDRGAPYL